MPFINITAEPWNKLYIIKMLVKQNDVRFGSKGEPGASLASLFPRYQRTE